MPYRFNSLSSSMPINRGCSKRLFVDVWNYATRITMKPYEIGDIRNELDTFPLRSTSRITTLNPKPPPPDIVRTAHQNTVSDPVSVSPNGDSLQRGLRLLGLQCFPCSARPWEHGVWSAHWHPLQRSARERCPMPMMNRTRTPRCARARYRFRPWDIIQRRNEFIIPS